MICCNVCGDTVCTIHYGSLCCNGCKVFFQRTVRSNKVYTCLSAKQCDVSKDTRNHCKACRFDKCLKVGMNPSLLRDNRGSHKKYNKTATIEKLDNKKASEDVSMVPKYCRHKNFSSNLDFYQNIDTEIKSIIISSKYFTRNRAQALGSLNLIPKYNDLDFQSISKYYVLVERLCDTYSEIDMNHLTKEFDDKCSLDVPQKIAVKEPGLICYRTKVEWDPKFRVTSEILKYTWCRCASIVLDWASHVMELSEINEQDQEILLVGRCIPLTWLMIGYKSVERNFNGVVFSGGCYFPGDKSEWPNIDADVFMLTGGAVKIMMQDFIQPAIEMQVTEAEYTLLRVICFLSPVPGMSQEAVLFLQQAREKYISVLSLVVQKCSPHLNVLEAMSRISKLIMLISIAEKVAEVEDNGMSLMSLFNLAQMRGTLPYDIHVRRYNTFSKIPKVG